MSENIQMNHNKEEVPEDKKGLVTWIKTHKRELIFSGVSVATLIAIVLGLKNKDLITEIWSSLKSAIEKVPSKCSIKRKCVCEQIQKAPITDVQPIREKLVYRNKVDVRRHIRTLPEGFHHSAAKAAEAAELEIDLLPNQTLVNAYVKGDVAA